MTLGRVERYTVRQATDGLHIEIRQTANALRLGLLLIGLIGVVWQFAPAHRSLCGFLGVLLALTVIASQYREVWLIASDEVIWTNSFRWREQHIPRSPTIAFRFTSDPREAYHLHLLGADQRPTRLRLEFQRRDSVDRFVKIVRPILSVDVVSATPS